MGIARGIKLGEEEKRRSLIDSRTRGLDGHEEEESSNPAPQLLQLRSLACGLLREWRELNEAGRYGSPTVH